MQKYVLRKGKGLIYEQYIIKGLKIFNPELEVLYVGDKVKEHDILIKDGESSQKLEVKADEYILHTGNIAVQIWTREGLPGWGQYCDADTLIYCSINIKKQVQEIRQFTWRNGDNNGLWDYIQNYTDNYVKNVVNIEPGHPKSSVVFIPIENIKKFLAKTFAFRETVE